MLDDIRRPQNKTNNDDKQIPHLETPHHYDQAGDFVAASTGRDHSNTHEPKIAWLLRASKKQKAIVAVVAAVLVIGGGGGVFAMTRGSKTPVTTPVQSAAPATVNPAKPIVSPLTGLPSTEELNKRPVTSIQIENSPDARPQSGLKDAGVVYEAIAEGGITRFNASFQEAQPDYIGPVRSVRPYYATLTAPFDPVFVHAGGSADGLAKLRELGLKDMDHGANANAFQRISQRYAPHNLYTNSAALDKASQGRGYTTSAIKSFERKAEQTGQAPTARVIDLKMSSALYNVHYDYDAASNTYKRSEGGKPHTDERSGQQLAPKTVVALVMSYSQNGIYSVYQTTGSGKAMVFQDGQLTQGTWTKAGDKDQLVFKKDDGSSLQLNAGQTWFTLVKTPGDVTSAP